MEFHCITVHGDYVENTPAFIGNNTIKHMRVLRSRLTTTEIIHMMSVNFDQIKKQNRRKRGEIVEEGFGKLRTKYPNEIPDFENMIQFEYGTVEVENQKFYISGGDICCDGGVTLYSHGRVRVHEDEWQKIMSSWAYKISIEAFIEYMFLCDDMLTHIRLLRGRLTPNEIIKIMMMDIDQMNRCKRKAFKLRIKEKLKKLEEKYIIRLRK